MMRAYKFRAYPTKKEKKNLNYQMLLAKQLYNLILGEAIKYFNETGKSFTNYQMNKWITSLKKEHTEFNGLYSQVLQNVADRVSKAYRNFFRRVKEKKNGKKIKVGFPRFKTFVSSLTYPQFGFEIITRKKGINVSNIGRMPVVFDRNIEGKVKTLTIKKTRSLDWYATISVEQPNKQFVSNNKEKVGMDLGLLSYATLSNGNKIENKRIESRYKKKLRRLQRSISRKPIGSRNRKTTILKFARLSEHIKNKRDDYIHKLSHNLVNSYSFIAYEKLKVANMVKNHVLARSISDVSWDRFVSFLCYKAESAGCIVAGVNPRNTSRTCSKCGNLKGISLAVRTFTCKKCGLSLDRDVNAAINILNTAGHAGIYASGENVNTAEKSAANNLAEKGTIYNNNLNTVIENPAF